MDFSLLDKDLLNFLDIFKSKLLQINVLKITPEVFSNVKLNISGKLVNFNSIASLTVINFKRIHITPYDISYTKSVYTALLALNLNVSFNILPSNEISATLPELTKELRFSFTKKVKSDEELAKITLRQLRQKWNNTIKESFKRKLINKDDERFFLNEVQKRIDAYILLVSELVKNKVTLLLSV